MRPYDAAADYGKLAWKKSEEAMSTYAPQVAQAADAAKKWGAEKYEQAKPQFAAATEKAGEALKVRRCRLNTSG